MQSKKLYKPNFYEILLSLLSFFEEHGPHRHICLRQLLYSVSPIWTSLTRLCLLLGCARFSQWANLASLTKCWYIYLISNVHKWPENNYVATFTKAEPKSMTHFVDSANCLLMSTNMCKNFHSGTFFSSFYFNKNSSLSNNTVLKRIYLCKTRVRMQ